MRSSTLRCTLAGILAGPLGLAIAEPRRLQPASEARLSEWMGAELSIAAWPTSPGVPLGAVEKQVVQTLRPPLNRGHLPPDGMRERLRERRAVVTHGIDDLWVAPDPGLTGWRQILAEYGQAFDGYRYARLVRRCECPELADEVWRLRAEKGQFCSDFADLRCALFWLQRCVRNAEQSPGWSADEGLERHVMELFDGVRRCVARGDAACSWSDPRVAMTGRRMTGLPAGPIEPLDLAVACCLYEQMTPYARSLRRLRDAVVPALDLRRDDHRMALLAVPQRLGVQELGEGLAPAGLQCAGGVVPQHLGVPEPVPRQPG